MSALDLGAVPPDVARRMLAEMSRIIEAGRGVMEVEYRGGDDYYVRPCPSIKISV